MISYRIIKRGFNSFICYNYEAIIKCTDNLLKFFLYIYIDGLETLLTQDSAAICITLVKVVQNPYCLPLTARSDLQHQVSKQNLYRNCALEVLVGYTMFTHFLYVMNSII